MTVAGQAAAQAGQDARAAAIASGASGYYDRGQFISLAPSIREKQLAAAVQTGQGFGSLGGSTVESRTAYARQLGFTSTEVRTATGELPFGTRRAEKQQTTQEALQLRQDELKVIRRVGGAPPAPQTQRPMGTTGAIFYTKAKEFGGEIKPATPPSQQISPEALKFLGIKQPGLPKAQPKPAEPQGITETLQRQQEKLFYTKQFGKTRGERVGARIEEAFTGLATGILAPFVLAGALVTSPKQTVINVARGLRPYELGKSIVVSVRDRPIGFAGEIAGSFASTAAFGETAKFLNPITRTQELKLALTGKYVSPEEVFAPEVLSGAETFPKARNVQSALEQFRRPTKIVNGERQVPVLHTTVAKFKSEETVVPGPAGRRLLEDIGLYVSPKGRGSPYFLKIGGVRPSSTFPKISLIPDFESLFKTPSVVEITTGGVERLPAKVLKTSGFESVEKYLATQVGKGKAFITKRFEQGQTGETEAVIPVGSKLIQKKTGKQLFTTFRTRVIPIQEFELKRGKVSVEEFENVAGNIAKAQQSFEGSFGRKTIRLPIETSIIERSLQQQFKPLSSGKATERVSSFHSDILRGDFFRPSTKRTSIERGFVDRPRPRTPPPGRPPPPERPTTTRTTTDRGFVERGFVERGFVDRPRPRTPPPTFIYPKFGGHELSINLETKQKISTKFKPSLFGITLGKKIKKAPVGKTFGGFEIRGVEKGLKLGGLFEGIATRPARIKKFKKRRLL